MSQWLWILWTILGGFLIVAEIFTSGFVLLWFGVGALAAALLAIIGIDSLAIQFLTFAIVSSVTDGGVANDLHQLLLTREVRTILAKRCGLIAG